MKSSLVLFACAGALALTSTVRASITEGFDTFPPAGWTLFNQSSPPLGNNWGVGNATVFAAQAGATTSYAAATYQGTGGTTGTETLDNWLMTPLLTGIQNGDTVSFFTRTVTGNPFPDRLELRLSTNGGTSTGGTTGSTGDFTTLLASVNPGLTVGGYPETWTQISVTIAGLGGPVNGAFGLRYFVTNGGPSGDNSDYIGVDTFQYSQVPAPAAGLLLLGGLGAMRRRR